MTDTEEREGGCTLTPLAAPEAGRSRREHQKIYFWGGALCVAFQDGRQRFPASLPLANSDVLLVREPAGRTIRRKTLRGRSATHLPPRRGS